MPKCQQKGVRHYKWKKKSVQPRWGATHISRRGQFITEIRRFQTWWNERNTFKNEMPTMWVDPLEQVLDIGCFLHLSIAASWDSRDALNHSLSHWIYISDIYISDDQTQARYSASHLVVSKYKDLFAMVKFCPRLLQHVVAEYQNHSYCDIWPVIRGGILMWKFDWNNRFHHCYFVLIF